MSVVPLFNTKFSCLKETQHICESCNYISSARDAAKICKSFLLAQSENGNVSQRIFMFAKKVCFYTLSCEVLNDI